MTAVGKVFTANSQQVIGCLYENRKTCIAMLSKLRLGRCFSPVLSAMGALSVNVEGDRRGRFTMDGCFRLRTLRTNRVKMARSGSGPWMSTVSAVTSGTSARAVGWKKCWRAVHEDADGNLWCHPETQVAGRFGFSS